MSTKKLANLTQSSSEFLIYKSPSGQVRVEALLKDENIWLTQEKIAQLFGVDRSVVSKHLKNIFAEEELDENSTLAYLWELHSDKIS